MRCIFAATLVLAVACAPDVPTTCSPPADPDVVNPCGSSIDAGVVALPGTPDAGMVPSGTVSIDGGTVDRLWFATTGDTRPANCDQTNSYPQAAIAQIATAMKTLRVQFTVDLGDHMYVCDGVDSEAQTQMGYYTSAIASGPSTWWMTMGNHECGSNKYPYACFVGGAHDANFSAYMSALKRPQPYYFTDVQTAQGKARFVFIADDAWDSTQSAWLSSNLTDADTSAKYTIIVRHHPVQGTRTGTGASGTDIPNLISAHKYTLILTAHNHDYEHDTATYGGRSTVVGLGGAGGYWGFATLLQNDDGTLTFVQRDANGNPVGTPWAVTPQ